MTKVLVVCTSTAAGLGLQALLADHASFEMAGQASDCSHALAMIERTSLDVVIAVSGPDVTDAIRLCRESPVPVLIVSPEVDERTVRAAVLGGARGYLFESVDRTFLEVAIGWVANGHAVLDPRITPQVIGWATSRRRSEHDVLSSREAEVLQLAGRGEPNRLIAKQMGLTENTVKTYLRRAFKKLDCHSRAAAAAALTQSGAS